MQKRKFSVSFMFAVLFLVLLFGKSYSAKAVDAISVESSAKQLLKSFEITESDATNPLKSAFKYCTENATAENPLTIKLPMGEFKINTALTLSSYTTFDMTSGTVLVVDTSAKEFIAFKNPVGKIGGYDSLIGFKMLGGNLKFHDGNERTCSLMRVVHARDVLIQNVVFNANRNAHLIEVAAANNLTFKGCSFIGDGLYAKKSGVEALQLDILDEKDHLKNSPPYDGTMSDGITVSDCTFKNLSIAVGTRTLFAHYYQSNITISNNIFENIDYTAINLSGCINSKVTGNKITTSGEGISFFMMNTDSGLKKVSILDDNGIINTNCSSVISNNSIQVNKTEPIKSPVGISIFGNNITENKETLFKKGDCFVGNITVSGNTITTPYNGIKLYNTKNSKILSNTILTDQKANTAFYVADSSNGNTISSNTVGKGFVSAFSLKDSSKNTLSKNTATSPSRFGIVFQSGCKSNSATENTLNSCGEIAISLSGATCSKINSNTISKPKKYAISLLSKSSATEISANKISSPSIYGIYASALSTVGKLNSNSVSKAKKHAIVLTDKATVKTMSQNTVSSAASNGIALLKGSLVKSMSKNKIKKSGNVGVYIDAQSTINSLTSNTVYEGKSNGIYCIGEIKKLSGNTLKKNGGYGIYLKSKAKAVIYDNTYLGNAKGDLKIENCKPTKLSNLEAPTVTSVKQGKKTLTFKWNTVTNANRYVLYTRVGKKGSYKKTEDLKKKSAQINAPKKGTTVYYKVRAVKIYKDITVYSEISKAEKYKVK